MEYLIGFLMALAIGFFATAVGFDRNRSFYPVVMIVIAGYYALFALVGGSLHALTLECIFIAGFVLVSVLGFKLNLWWVAGALPGVPVWWPGWCLAYDVTAAGYLAWLLRRSKGPERP